MRALPDLLTSCVASSTLLSLSEPQLHLVQTGNYPHLTGEEMETQVTELINGVTGTQSMVLDLIQLLMLHDEELQNLV